MAIRQEPQVVFHRTTNLVTLQGLREKTTGEYPTNATVTCTLLDGAGSPIPNATNISMPFVAGTLGKNSLYRGVLDSGVDYTGVAKARIAIVRDGAQREINVPCAARDG